MCNQRFVKLTLVLKNLQISLHILLLRVIFQFFHRQKERKIDFLYIKALHKIERNINFDFKGYFWGSKQFFIRASCFGFHNKGCLSETPRLILLTCSRNTNRVWSHHLGELICDLPTHPKIHNPNCKYHKWDFHLNCLILSIYVFLFEVLGGFSVNRFDYNGA